MHSFSRRQFLAHTIRATAALASVGSLSVGSLAAQSAPALKLPIVIFTKVYQPLKLSFEDSASLTAEAGLNGVDSPVRPGGEILPERASQDLSRYVEALQKHKLTLPLLTTAITDPSSPHAEEILRAAKKAGAQFYRTGFIDRTADQPAKKQITEVRSKLKDLAAMNKQIGIGAIFQNHSPAGRTYLGGDLNELADIVADFDPNEIGVAFDIGHALKVHREAWREHFEKLKSHLKIVYIKDVNRQGAWVRFGEGEIGNVGYFKLLREIGYNAPVGMHIEFDWSNKGKNQTREVLLKALKESSTVLRGWLEQPQ
jgi:sugar phosphate isomerase/epimerase